MEGRDLLLQEGTVQDEYSGLRQRKNEKLVIASKANMCRCFRKLEPLSIFQYGSRLWFCCLERGPQYLGPSKNKAFKIRDTLR